MPQRLTKLTATRVALVDRGANQEAHVVLFKRDGEAALEPVRAALLGGIAKMYDQNGQMVPDPAQTFNEVLAATEAASRTEEIHDAVCPLIGALREAMHSIIDDPEATDKPAMIQESADQFIAELKDALAAVGKIAKQQTKTEGGAEYPAAAFAYVPDPEQPSTWKLRLWESPAAKATAAQVGRAIAALGKGFRGRRVQIPAADLAAVKAKVRAAWRQTHADMSMDDMPAVLKGEETMLTPQEVEALQKSLEAEKARAVTAEAALKTAQDELAKLAPQQTPLEKKLATMPAEIRKDYEAELAKRDTETAELRKRLDAAEDVRKTEEFVKQAREQYANLPGENNGAVLKAIHTLPETDRNATLALLKAANEAFGSLYREHGTSRGITGSATEKLTKAAEEIRKADPKVTSADAFVRACEQNPELVREYRAEQRA